MEIWTPKVGGDSVHLKCDNWNERDMYAVTVLKNWREYLKKRE